MGELPFSVYFEFETTSRKKVCEFEENAELYTVPYAFVVALNPELKQNRIFVERSFSHTFNELNYVSYVPSEMLHYFDPMTARQLRDCARNVYEKTGKVFDQRDVFVRT